MAWSSVLKDLLVVNVPSKSLLSVRGMEGRVSSNLKGGSCFRLKARIYFVLSTLMQCAAEQKYCSGVLGQLRGRATARLRGNIDSHDKWTYNINKMSGMKIQAARRSSSRLVQKDVSISHVCFKYYVIAWDGIASRKLWTRVALQRVSQK